MAETTERLQQAIAAARAGNIGEAKSLAEQLVEEDPNNPHALFLLGMLAEDQSEQLDYMEKVLTIDPDHKAANKRMDQLAANLQLDDDPREEAEPDVEAETEPELEEIAEAQLVPEVEEEVSTDDVTIVAGAAAVAATAAAMDDTVLSEPDASLGVQDEAFFDVSQSESEEVEAPADAALDETALEETVISAAVVDEAALIEATSEEELEQLSEETSLEDTLPPGALVGGAVVAAAAAQNEDIPDWLLAEARTEEELVEFDETVLWGEEEVESAEELPDWLQNESAEEWVDEQAVEETVLVAAAAADETVIDDSPSDFDDIAEPVDELDAGGDEPITEEPALDQPTPAKSKKSPPRTLEIALGVLIFVALLLVAALAFAIINAF
jgi:hypothetical protein